jgi:hypothetical protein
MKYIIKDWADNTLFKGQEFDSFDDAESFLASYFEDQGLNYDDERGERGERGEYEVVVKS